jgi:Intein splicing domain/HNH endonuclease
MSLADMVRQAKDLAPTIKKTGLSLDVFEEEPVSLSVFVSDKKFLNNPPLSEVQYAAVQHAERIYYSDLYPLMLDEGWLYWTPDVRMVNLITLQWGKGSGKDHICRMASLRIAYMLLCLKSPQEYYGLPPQDSIHSLNVASTSGQATNAFFKPLTEAVKRGWFADKCEPKQGSILWDKHVESISGHSDAESQEGLNLILGIADEIDAFRSKEEQTRSRTTARESTNSAESILSMLNSSASTRFPFTYKVMRISYPRYAGSTIQQLVKTAQADVYLHGADSRHYVSGPLDTWDVNPRFKGMEFVDVPGCEVPVPRVYERDFIDDAAEANGKYRCKPSRSYRPYFHNFEILESCMVPRDPVKIDYRLVTSQLGGKVWEPAYLFDRDFLPIVGAQYALHADMAHRHDRAGLALSHVQSWRKEQLVSVDQEGGFITTNELVPVVKTDFVIVYTADLKLVPAREIQLRWARQLAFRLVELGFNLRLFSFDGWQCVSGDTVVPLLDGREIPIRNLVGSEQFWVYSCSPEGRVVPGLCKKAWSAGVRQDMLEVELDNGAVVRCTSDHPWMMRDGSYSLASALVPGDSLMPLYRRYKKTSASSKEYEQVWHPEPASEERQWMFTHSVVSRFFDGPVPFGSVTHHCNMDHRDNTPENLQQLTNEEHTSVHMLHRGSMFKNLWQDPEWSANHRKRLSELRKSTRLPHHVSEVTFEDIEEVSYKMFLEGRLGWREVAAELKCSQDVLYDRIRKEGFASWIDFKREIQPQSYGALATERSRAKARAIVEVEAEMAAEKINHTVVSVRPCAAEEVFDLEVEGWHNFAVASGVFIHNSLDSIQILQARGVEARVQSVDKTDEAWKTLRDLTAEGRVSFPDNPLLRIELQSLTRFAGGRVDHPANGSKDSADALAGSLLGALSIGGQEDESGDIAWPGTTATFDVLGLPVGESPIMGRFDFGQESNMPIGFEGMGSVRP